MIAATDDLTTESLMRRTLRRTIQLLVPGITLFTVLLIVSIVGRALPVPLAVGLLFYGFGLIPVTVILGIVIASLIYWRRHWLSGLSLLCTAPLVLVCGVFPKPIYSPVGWAANALKVIYYHDDLQRAYQAARMRGQTPPVGQILTDGLGSVALGLAYDPSGEIALPANQRSPAWTAGPGATELGIENLEAHHIWGAYYQWFHP
jgi:hypothetical protein